MGPGCHPVGIAHILWGKDTTMTAFKAISALALAGAVLVPAGPASADMYGHHHYRYASASHVITVSCYRGPWEDVIWDRPNPVFTDSLVAAGYTFPEAHAIAERVCRDPAAVNRPGVLQATMSNILRTSPPGS